MGKYKKLISQTKLFCFLFFFKPSLLFCRGSRVPRGSTEQSFLLRKSMHFFIMFAVCTSRSAPVSLISSPSFDLNIIFKLSGYMFTKIFTIYDNWFVFKNIILIFMKCFGFLAIETIICCADFLAIGENFYVNFCNIKFNFNSNWVNT